MEIYFDPDVLKRVALEFQQDLLEGLTECRYSPGSRGGVFVNSENAKQSWLKEEEKIISISPNGNGRSHNDRLYAYYDRKTDRMYVFHYLTDHNTSNKDTMNKLIAEGPDAINYDIMEKINAHQAALDSGQNPEGLGFEDAKKVHLNARQTANFARERLDLNKVFKDKSHLKGVCESLQGEFYEAMNKPKGLDELKGKCMNPKNDLLPNTVEGKQTILQYAETDPEFKKFLEEMYVEYEKMHPLITDAEIEARKNQSHQDKLNSIHTDRENIISKWKPIDSNNPSKGYVATISQQYQARQMADKLKTLGIECEYDTETKSLRITDPESIKKFEDFKGHLPDNPLGGPGGHDDGRDGGGTTENPDNNEPKAGTEQPNSDAEQPNRANQNGDQPNNNAEQPNRANQNGDQPNSDGRNTGNQTRRRLRTLSQNAWQNIDPNDPSKGIQKRVQNSGEARRMMGQYQRLGIQCRYNENTNSIEITDAESVQKLHELRTRNTTHGSRTTSRPTSVGIRSGGRQNNAARTNGSTPRRGRGRGSQIQTVINLVR